MRLKGWIVRRRCFGKNLAFSDILTNEEFEHEELLEEPALESSESNSNTKQIEVMFQRGVEASVWDRNTSPTKNEFPTKSSALPYGALVSLDICEPLENTKIYRVKSFQILQNPRQEALLAAKEGKEDGVSCSTYLRIRKESYSKFNTQIQTPKVKKKSIQNIDTTERDDRIEGQFGTHGSNKAKGMRATIFATWLIETYGRDTLAMGQGVIDVAGGKGRLSIQLSLQGKIQSTIIDPLVRKHGTKLCTIGAKRIRKANSPHPALLSKEFNRTTFLTENEELVRQSSMLVGLHPDEPTEDILDVALMYDKNFAIVPCCVFPCFFPHRILPDGRYVNTYDEFLEYLLLKDHRLRKQSLPFEGRNIVIYRK